MTTAIRFVFLSDHSRCVVSVSHFVVHPYYTGFFSYTADTQIPPESSRSLPFCAGAKRNIHDEHTITCHMSTSQRSSSQPKTTERLKPESPQPQPRHHVLPGEIPRNARPAWWCGERQRQHQQRQQQDEPDGMRGATTRFHQGFRTYQVGPKPVEQRYQLRDANVSAD